MNEQEHARAQAIKVVRNTILQTLNVWSTMGKPAPFDIVWSGVVHLEVEDDALIVRDLTNLCDKGYVRCRLPSWAGRGDHVPWKKRLFELTAKGQDFVDKIERDPTLEL